MLAPKPTPKPNPDPTTSPNLTHNITYSFTRHGMSERAPPVTLYNVYKTSN